MRESISPEPSTIVPEEVSVREATPPSSEDSDETMRKSPVNNFVKIELPGMEQLVGAKEGKTFDETRGTQEFKDELQKRFKTIKARKLPPPRKLK